MRYRVEFFRPSEFACRCCGKGGISPALALWLDLVRRAWGAPVRVNSGWRCPEHNAKVGGAGKSRHLFGCAADIAPVSGDADDTGRFLFLARRMCPVDPNDGWETRMYRTFIHVGIPGENSGRMWNGEDIRI